MQRGPQPTQDTTLKTTKQKETLKIGRAAAPGEHYVFGEDGLLTGLTHVGNFVSVLNGPQERRPCRVLQQKAQPTSA